MHTHTHVPKKAGRGFRSVWELSQSSITTSPNPRGPRELFTQVKTLAAMWLTAKCASAWPAMVTATLLPAVCTCYLLLSILQDGYRDDQTDMKHCNISFSSMLPDLYGSAVKLAAAQTSSDEVICILLFQYGWKSESVQLRWAQMSLQIHRQEVECIIEWLESKARGP